MNKVIFTIAALSLVAGILLATTLLPTKPIKLQAGTWFGDKARALPEFVLYDRHKKAFGPEQFKDKWTLLFFGYTNCPDICPDSLQMLANMMQQVEDDDIKKQIQVMFVSVDPERDTPEKLHKYVTYFNPDFLGATADIPKLQVLTKALGIMHYTTKTEESKVKYDVAHSSAIILINPKAEYNGLFSAPHDSRSLASDMQLIIGNS